MILTTDRNPVGLDSPLILTFATRLFHKSEGPVCLVYNQHDTREYLGRVLPYVKDRTDKLWIMQHMSERPFDTRADFVILSPVHKLDQMRLNTKYAHCAKSFYAFSPGDEIYV